MDITTVYVPLDGSDRAATAIGPALALADRTEAEVVLLATPWPGERLDTVERHLDAQVAFTEHPKVRPLVVLDREPADAICTVAADPGALVCMSTRGRGAARGTLLGSVGEAVLRSTSRPLLFVGPSFDPVWSLPEAPVVIAGIDGSRHSFEALVGAGELAVALHGRVRAVEVLRPADRPLPGSPDWDTTETLDQIIATLREHGVRVESVVVDGFDPADALTAEARHRRAAFVAVASHGRTGLARAVLGSVAVATVRKAPCPVLVSGPAVHRHAADGNE
jgi:nucleotide-binding universal stress UspA family protein